MSKSRVLLLMLDPLLALFLHVLFNLALELASMHPCLSEFRRRQQLLVLSLYSAKVNIANLINNDVLYVLLSVTFELFLKIFSPKRELRLAFVKLKLHFLLSGHD